LAKKSETAKDSYPLKFKKRKLIEIIVVV